MDRVGENTGLYGNIWYNTVTVLYCFGRELKYIGFSLATTSTSSSYNNLNYDPN